MAQLRSHESGCVHNFKLAKCQVGSKQKNLYSQLWNRAEASLSLPGRQERNIREVADSRTAGIFIQDTAYFIVIHLTMSHSSLNNNENMPYPVWKYLAYRSSQPSYSLNLFSFFCILCHFYSNFCHFLPHFGLSHPSGGPGQVTASKAYYMCVTKHVCGQCT